MLKSIESNLTVYLGGIPSHLSLSENLTDTYHIMHERLVGWVIRQAPILLPKHSKKQPAASEIMRYLPSI